MRCPRKMGVCISFGRMSLKPSVIGKGSGYGIFSKWISDRQLCHLDLLFAKLLVCICCIKYVFLHPTSRISYAILHAPTPSYLPLFHYESIEEKVYDIKAYTKEERLNGHLLDVYIVTVPLPTKASMIYTNYKKRDCSGRGNVKDWTMER